MKLNRAYNSRTLFALLAVLGCLYAFSLWDRQADPDDAWIGEHAYWLAKEGHARSELMRGITGQEDYLIVHHKLLNLQGALFIKIFGFSLYTLKSVSLLYFVLFLLLLYYYLAFSKNIRDRNMLLLVFSLLISFPWLFKFSFVYRPEVMVMTLAFAGWISLEKALEEPGNMQVNALVAGLLGGLGFSAHLNGIVVAAAGFLLLLIHRRWVPALVFAVGALAGASVYFYDFNAAHGWEYWIYQLTQSPALDGVPSSHPLLRPLLNLINEHQRFFHNPMIIFFSAFMIFTLIIGYPLIKARWKNMALYSLIIAVLLGMVAAHKARHYLLIYIPFLMIMLGDISNEVLSGNAKEILKGWRRSRFATAVLIFLLMAFIGSGIYYNTVYSIEKFKASDNAGITAKYVDEDPATVNVIAPMTFIFNEIEKFKRIQADLSFFEMSKSDQSIKGKGLLDKAREFGIRYIILSPFERKRLGWENPLSITLPDDFIILSGKDDENLIIKRIKQ